MNALTIGKLAREAGVGIDTLRYYEKIGLIKPQYRTAAGYRIYDDSSVQKLQFIRRGQGLGFTLNEIQSILEFGTSRNATAADVLHLTKAKIDQFNEKLGSLQRIRKALIKVAKHCPGKGPVSECPIFEYLQEG